MSTNTTEASEVDTSTLRKEVRALADLRSTLASTKAMLDGATATFNAQHKDEIDLIALTEKAIATAELNVRTLGAAAYAQGAGKTPAPGVTIKVGKSINYDLAEAMAFCEEKGLAITPAQLNVKAFEVMAKQSPESFPFVTVSEVATVQIAKNLDSAIEAGE